MGKKLIEVALPLEAINEATAKERASPFLRGHPRSLHPWWSRKPLAACRAVLFASLIDDPSSRPEQFPTSELQEKERRRLFRILEDLLPWGNSNNQAILEAARQEIQNCCRGNLPTILDPFAGGGSILIEAQRLGLEAHGCDLNPVAVLITKALIEIPGKFAGILPVHPDQERELIERGWSGAEGLAEDVRWYGNWMRAKAEHRIGRLYPEAQIPASRGGGKKKVIAWLWVRTVQCPNPACRVTVPLASNFLLSDKKGKRVWAEPVIKNHGIHFKVKEGESEPKPGTIHGGGAVCPRDNCRTTIPFKYIRDEGIKGQMGQALMTMVVKGAAGRLFLDPDPQHMEIAQSATASEIPDTSLPKRALGFRVQNYGITKHYQLFSARQLMAMTTFNGLVLDAHEKILADAKKAFGGDVGPPLREGDQGPRAYADAVTTYLALGVSRMADVCNSLCRWQASAEQIRNLFSRQVIPMTWNFAEPNPFSEGVGDFRSCLSSVARAIETTPSSGRAFSHQGDATLRIDCGSPPLICCDPPYYDNISYGDLSDFFYIWLRPSLKDIYPELFSTVLTPKENELVADPFRHGGTEGAKQFFEERLGMAFRRLREAQNPDFPFVVFYAFKQSEKLEDLETDPGAETTSSSTGWETMLEGLLRAGFTITGTWPLRTEMVSRMRSLKSNALASSIVLACRPRSISAGIASRREFLAALKREMSCALKMLLEGNIAPVDLSQAAIGPGMAIFSRYAKVIEADGSSVTIKAALQAINEELDLFLTKQDGELDRDSRFCLEWFKQYGFEEGPFGEADVLSRAKNTSVDGLVVAGVFRTRAGRAKLLAGDELSSTWKPFTDKRLTVWEVTHYLIRALDGEGEVGAANLLRDVRELGDQALDLSYRLFAICERKNLAKEALLYNSLVVAWPEISKISLIDAPGTRQTEINIE